MNQNSFTIEVFGTPIPQGSLRRTPYGVIHSNDEALKLWRNKVQIEITNKMPTEWDIETSETAAVSVVADFRFARPKSHYGKKGLRPSAPKHKTPRCDLDKCIRAISDSMEQAYLVKDDSQIVQWIASKRWMREDEKPGVHLTIINQSSK